ncbi:hypothetical protein diail_6487 [Diaporthe ilicicola]|nr:hypothetical protein diail_6487 [Diaporthe ilicicola]
MALRDSSVMTDSIAKFLLMAQEQAEHSPGQAKRFDDEISSLKELITTLQGRLAVQETRPPIVDPAIVERHEQDIEALQEAIDSLKDTNKSLQEADNSLQGRVNQVEARASQVESDNTRLQDEIARLSAKNADLFAELDHAERLLTKAEAATAQHQGGHPRLLESRKPADEQQPRPQRNVKDQMDFPSPDGHKSHNRAHQQTRSLQLPRGVKRSYRNVATEPPHWRQPAQESDHTLDCETPKMSGEINARDEVPRRKQKRLANEEGTVDARRKAFGETIGDLWLFMQRKYNERNYEKEQRRFIWLFIDAIQARDQELSRWFQQTLMEQLPEKVHRAKKPARKPGDRYVAMKADLTWDEVQDVLRDLIQRPPFMG